MSNAQRQPAKRHGRRSLWNWQPECLSVLSAVPVWPRTCLLHAVCHSLTIFEVVIWDLVRSACGFDLPIFPEISRIQNLVAGALNLERQFLFAS